MWGISGCCEPRTEKTGFLLTCGEERGGSRERGGRNSPQPGLQLPVHVLVEWPCCEVTTPVMVVTVTVREEVTRQDGKWPVTFLSVRSHPRATLNCCEICCQSGKLDLQATVMTDRESSVHVPDCTFIFICGCEFMKSISFW